MDSFWKIISPDPDTIKWVLDVLDRLGFWVIILAVFALAIYSLKYIGFCAILLIYALSNIDPAYLIAFLLFIICILLARKR
jgi:hypothetical protein